MTSLERDAEHLAKEMAKWYWKKYAIRKDEFAHYKNADWYKYRRGFDGRLLDQSQRSAYVKALMKRPPEDFSREELVASDREFEKFLQSELLKGGPSIPEFPVLDWLAKSIFRWYWPALWTVDMNAPDWLSQIRKADKDRAFSYAECEAYAVKKRLEIGPVERLFLRVVTREGNWRDVRRISWDPPTPHPPYVLEGYHNPTLIMSSELRRSLAMSNAEAKARRRLTRDELASSRPRHRPGRRKFTPSGSLKRKYLKTERV